MAIKYLEKLLELLGPARPNKTHHLHCVARTQHKGGRGAGFTHLALKRVRKDFRDEVL